MIEGSCHCGRVTFQITQEPAFLSECNCSMCRRIAALWGYVDVDAFSLTSTCETIAYMQGDKTLALHTCAHCGCTTHWEQHHPDFHHMGINFRMCDPAVTERFKIRRFDGAETWQYLD